MNAKAKRIPVLAGILLGSGMAVVPLCALADSRPLPAAPESQRQLEEIMVTAQKREEKLQDVPIAVSAFSQTALETMGFTNFSDLANKVPALNIIPFPQGSSSLIVTMRGITQGDPVQIALDPGVGVYLDDIYLARGQGVTTDLGDVERIEVLRGPQGTLYGRNTVGGAVKFVTAKPTGELGFKQSLDMGNYGLLRSVTNLNLPQINGFSIKLTAIASDYDGWVKAAGAGPNFGEKHENAFRVALRWRPMADLLVDYAYDKANHTGTNNYEQYQYTNAFPFAFPLFPERQERAWRATQIPMKDNFISEGHALTLTGNISDLTTLKSITSYRKLGTDAVVDTLEAFNLPAGSIQRLQHHQFSQEFLFNGTDGSKKTKYNLGAFYFREVGHAQTTDLANPFLLAFSFPYVGPTMADFAPLTPARAENKSLALYGNVSHPLPILDERLTLDVGGRYSRETRIAERQGAAPGNTDYSSFDPSMTLDYRWTDKVHAYAKYSRAFRSGGFNLRNTSLAPFGPEKLSSFELGMKSIWFDGAMILNLAAFAQRYKDIQLQFLNPGSSPLQVVSVNAGTQSSRGVEVDFEVMPMTGLRLSANASAQDIGNVKATDPFTSAAYDAPPPQSPKLSYNLGADYRFKPFSFGVLSMAVNHSYSDKFLAGGGPTEFNPAYRLTNARLTLSRIPVGRGDLSVSLWAKNLTDAKYIGGYHAFGAAIFGEPRSYGINLTYNY